jgi:hypothetical protein
MTIDAVVSHFTGANAFVPGRLATFLVAFLALNVGVFYQLAVCIVFAAGRARRLRDTSTVF